MMSSVQIQVLYLLWIEALQCGQSEDLFKPLPEGLKLSGHALHLAPVNHQLK